MSNSTYVCLDFNLQIQIVHVLEWVTPSRSVIPSPMYILTFLASWCHAMILCISHTVTQTSESMRDDGGSNSVFPSCDMTQDIQLNKNTLDVSNRWIRSVASKCMHRDEIIQQPRRPHTTSKVLHTSLVLRLVRIPTFFDKYMLENRYQ